MTLRVLLCIPTYNNPGSITRVVAGALAETEFDILIVDDGSTPAVHVAQQERVQIVRHETNLGKGAAIQSAIKWAVGEVAVSPIS